MSSKAKAETKVPTLKGPEAESKVLEYLKAMNRPYGAVDVAANLKGAVPKATVQKILVALAEKGELIQKIYGKTTFFVVNQANLEIVPAEQLSLQELDLRAVEEENAALSADVKVLSLDLGRIKSTPTDDELGTQNARLEAEISQIDLRLQPLRTGVPPISAEDLQKIQCEWEKWRAEWLRRRKIMRSLWSLATDALPPQESESLEEALGIEKDTPEHETLEQSSLCAPRSLKRKLVDSGA